jgi:PAS domain S-box-containing protein
VVDFLLLDDDDPGDPEAIGGSFTSLGLRTESVADIQRVLLSALLDDVPPEAGKRIRDRLPDLAAGIMGGLTRVGVGILLEEQEEIREAYALSLRQAEEQLRIKNAGIESSINAIMMFDLNGEITYVNPAFLTMWGYEGDSEILGTHVSRFGEWRGDVERALEIVSRHDGWVGELVAVRRDGSRFDVRASVSTIRDDVGLPSQLMAFFVDVTQRNKTQAALRRRAAQAAFLNKIGEEIAGERTAEDVLERAVQLAQETFDFHHVCILLFDPDRQHLVLAARASTAEGSGCSVRPIALGEGITGWVAQHRQTVVANDIRREPRYLKIFCSEDTTRSELAVPICRGGHLVGVLDVQSPVRGAFGRGERTVLETLADQIAVALENARLYQALQEELAQRRVAEQMLRRTVRRLETVHEIDQAILGAESMEEVARALLRNVRRLVPCQRASIDLFDFETDEVSVIAAVQTIGQGRAAAGACFPVTLHQRLFEMLGHHQVAYVRDLREMPQSSPLVRTLCEEGLRSILVGPITFQGELIGMLTLSSQMVDDFEQDHRPIVQELADTAGIAIQQARLFDSVKEQQERLRKTMARLAEAEELQRRRVVRELHDQIGQNLTALDLNLSTVRSELEQGGLEELSARIADSLALVEQTNRRIRRLMIELRPPVLDDYGLLAALHWYGDHFSARTGIAVAVKGGDEVADNLLPHVENALFRIAQEALNNTAKHAHADEVTIAMTADETTIELAIKDNGVGFELENMDSGRASWGLLTMRERAESVGARCLLDSSADDGTRVVVQVPR